MSASEWNIGNGDDDAEREMSERASAVRQAIIQALCNAVTEWDVSYYEVVGVLEHIKTDLLEIVRN